MIAAVVALWAAATDRFYIEDFTIAAGETRTVSILLDNETAYTAFQTDLYLPDGLTAEQEDGDYIFSLTARKARDHSLASQPQPNGSIRLMSYSPRINAYSGNSGALVTFNVTADDDFAGPVTIELKNTLFTTTAGREVALSDESCQVTSTVTIMLGDVNGDGVVNVSDATALINYLVNEGAAAPIVFDNADMNGDGLLNVSDATNLINQLLNSH